MQKTFRLCNTSKRISVANALNFAAALRGVAGVERGVSLKLEGRKAHHFEISPEEIHTACLGIPSGQCNAPNS